MSLAQVPPAKVRVKHGFLSHRLNADAETIIIGTFNPGCICGVDFFYSGPHNRLWRLLPNAFGQEDLRRASPDQKIEFSRCRRIDFIDIISEVEVDKGQECNRNDSYLNDRITEWRDVIGEIGELRQVRRLCFTRKTFNRDVREIEKRVGLLKDHFGSRFRLMSSPAWYPAPDEQAKWTEFLDAPN